MHHKFLILAPSGAGKSHFITHNPDVKVMDGDKIIRDTIGWPKGRWWETLSPRDIERVHRNNEHAITEWADAHPDYSILFNGRWDQSDRVRAVVIPLWSQHWANLQARKAAGVVNQPTDREEAIRNRLALLEYATTHQTPVYRAFRGAIPR